LQPGVAVGLQGTDHQKYMFHTEIGCRRKRKEQFYKFGQSPLADIAVVVPAQKQEHKQIHLLNYEQFNKQVCDCIDQKCINIFVSAVLSIGGQKDRQETLRVTDNSKVEPMDKFSERVICNAKSRSQPFPRIIL